MTHREDTAHRRLQQNVVLHANFWRALIENALDRFGDGQQARRSGCVGRRVQSLALLCIRTLTPPPFPLAGDICKRVAGTSGMARCCGSIIPPGMVAFWGCRVVSASSIESGAWSRDGRSATDGSTD